MALELDHVFCLVRRDGPWQDALAGAGWTMDPGIEHPGQGSANRRLPLGQQYLELLWLSSRAEAERNPLRLDRRADWRTTGASPFGIGLRGEMPDGLREEFWAYQPPYAPGFQMWIHRDNERCPERPLLFVMEASGEALERMRTRMNRPGQTGRAASLREVRVEGSAEARPLLTSLGAPAISQGPGARPLMRVVVGQGPTLRVDDALELVG